MRIRFAIILSSLVFLLLIGWMLGQSFAGKAQIILRSEPFPMTFGASRLDILVLDKDGTAIDDVIVQVSTQVKQAGSPEIAYYPNQVVDGVYQVPVVWSMMGQATVKVSAELPNQGGTVEESFPVFVYLVPPLVSNYPNNYPSFDVINADVLANASQEYWIVIPQGTREMILMGEGDEFVPAQIRLKLNGQNTLVIRNNDFADHTIGPFFVRAGETVRQEFTQAAIFEGTCSIRHNASIKIIVE